MVLAAMTHLRLRGPLEKKMVLQCKSLLLGVLIAAIEVYGQSPGTEGFISIDCGATVNSTDIITGIPYTTDDGFIETGVNYNVSSNYFNSSLPKQYSTVRSFPGGDRNCYTLQPANQDNKYLVRASFMYGNYDGKNSAQNDSPLSFDLYIGIYLWKTVKIYDPFTSFTYEAMTTIEANQRLSVCLIRTNSFSTPFISLLELRLLNNTLYGKSSSYSYNLLMRRNLGATAGNIIRYPDDPYDRIWEPMNITLGALTTDKTIKIDQSDVVEAPPVVLRTASISADINDTIRFFWNSSSVCYVILHFSELELLSEKDSREFDVYVDAELPEANYTPAYLKPGSVHDRVYGTTHHNFSLNASKRTTRPPLLNAFEIYDDVSTGNDKTDAGDVEAIWKIKETYKLKKNWVSDPCLPKQYVWDGVNCSSDFRITAIDLSSSGLVGDVSTFFSKFTALEFLDLSYNNLSGKIPYSLVMISKLKVLNFTGNCITEVPAELIGKSKDGVLLLRYDNNTDTCYGTKATPSSNYSTATNKKITTPIIIVLSVVPAIVLLVVAVLIVWRIRRKTQGGQTPYTSHQSSVGKKDSQLPFESRQFMYTELESITKNFSRTLGRGGFGTVFHGSLEDGTEVAVKMCSLSSEQASNLFLAEVENLSTVRHKNLVSLIGYCMDRGQLVLVYEYMPLGSLEDHLKGRADNNRVLSWTERLRIVIDAAQGLDYLYNGCQMPIIHRDIKTSNMLLGQNLECKISDFGLSKALHGDFQTHVSVTTFGYTPGYIDPMCFQSGRFNEKTDVYSFGVVLLEIVTGKPPIQRGTNVHIFEYVQQSFEAGDINAIVDTRLQGMYDIESVWKVSELAIRCMARDTDQRPKMSEVVMQLRASLKRERSKSTITESKDITLTKKPIVLGPSAKYADCHL